MTNQRDQTGPRNDPDSDDSRLDRHDPEFQSPIRRRSPLKRTLGIAVGFSGLIWILQGLGILTAGNSFMVGDPKWIVIGAAFVLLGAALIVRGSTPAQR
ncbi:MAG: hypothetical protein ABI555_06680 [Chloroflexota bacterium]